MSSPLFPGQIPLPPDPSAAGGAAAAPVAASLVPAAAAIPPLTASAVQPPLAYDASTLAYYNAYYAQYGQYMAAVAGGAAGACWPTAAYAGASAAVPQSWSALAPQVPLATAAAAAVAAAAAGGDEGSGCAAEEEEEENLSQKRNVLPVHGNEKTMNLNSLILTNIQQSNYFRNTLYGIKTFNELVDEIWENVKHCEPWERASRKVPLLLLLLPLSSCLVTLT